MFIPAIVLFGIYILVFIVCYFSHESMPSQESISSNEPTSFNEQIMSHPSSSLQEPTSSKESNKQIMSHFVEVDFADESESVSTSSEGSSVAPTLSKEIMDHSPVVVQKINALDITENTPIDVRVVDGQCVFQCIYNDCRTRITIDARDFECRTLRCGYIVQEIPVSQSPSPIITREVYTQAPQHGKKKDCIEILSRPNIVIVNGCFRPYKLEKTTNQKDVFHVQSCSWDS